MPSVLRLTNGVIFIVWIFERLRTNIEIYLVITSGYSNFIRSPLVSRSTPYVVFEICRLNQSRNEHGTRSVYWKWLALDYLSSAAEVMEVETVWYQTLRSGSSSSPDDELHSICQLPIAHYFAYVLNFIFLHVCYSLDTMCTAVFEGSCFGCPKIHSFKYHAWEQNSDRYSGLTGVPNFQVMFV